ncbi:MAG: class I SAM-dependent methyltransferase [Methanocella conradii]|nr:class I SAM-dependent methyltransferase [Methanocella conradii]MDI6896838.1 class I SAM-dependent methyltransferase [Methanocella conradii]
MDKILDFGCGWGRVSRCFLREVSAGRLIGCDCIPDMVKLCNDTIKDYRFIRNDPLPPLQFDDNTFDLLYAFSVFSHLSEAAHKAWLREFYRVMKPGSILILTTRPRDFISYWPKLPYIQNINAEKFLEDYDHGKYVHIPASGGDTLSESFYGETAIPETYILREWSQWFDINQFLDYVPHVDQKVIIAMRV